MKNWNLATVGAACALVMLAGFIAGVILVGASGAEDVIPEPGEAGQNWIAKVDENRGLFAAGAWLVVFAGFFGLVAFIGFYDALRQAGPLMIIAPVAGAVGMTLNTVSHALPIAMAYELVPQYLAADGAARYAIAATFDTLASICLVLNYASNALGWGVTTPIYAIGILKTGVAPKWVGWMGLVAAVFAGWLALLGPASSVVEGLSAIGFLAFFIFVAGFGVALLLRQFRTAGRQAAGQAVVQ